MRVVDSSQRNSFVGGYVPCICQNGHSGSRGITVEGYFYGSNIVRKFLGIHYCTVALNAPKLRIRKTLRVLEHPSASLRVFER